MVAFMFSYITSFSKIENTVIWTPALNGGDLFVVEGSIRESEGSDPGMCLVYIEPYFQILLFLKLKIIKGSCSV